MTVKELIILLEEQDQDKEVHFDTIFCVGMELLSVYEDEDGDGVIIDVGTEEDNEERNACGCGK